MNYRRNSDEGFIAECRVRFYEGEVSTLNEPHPQNRIMRPVTRYRRAKEIQTKIYRSDSFGNIKTDKELVDFLNKELLKESELSGRVVIAEQKQKNVQ